MKALMKTLAFVMLLGGLGACVSAETLDPCVGVGDAGVPVSGGFKDGKGQDPYGPPVATFPFATSAFITSDYPIRAVSIGDVPTTFDATAKLWRAQHSASDLLNQRQEGTGLARLTIRVWDVCNISQYLPDVALVPVGPAAPIRVQTLSVQVGFVPETECALPASGRVRPLVRVFSESEAAAGAKVTLTASAGTFSTGAATQELVLAAAGGRAEATTYYAPPTEAGFATLTASALGAQAAPQVLPVVAPPEILAPDTALERERTYAVTVRSAGNLATCFLDESILDTSTVRFVEPALGLYPGGVVDVSRGPVSCAAPEYVRLQVTFAKDAPDGSALTLRCADSFVQETARTLQVKPR